MWSRRTDLADEAHELFSETAEKTTLLHGVRAKNQVKNHCHLTRVEVLDEEGSRAIGKPIGTYITVDLPSAEQGVPFSETACCLGEVLKTLLPKHDPAAPVLIAGLGNRQITPDALGSKAVEQILVTRHLKESFPDSFSAFTSVCAISAGVLGTTGVESAEWIRGIAQRVQPQCVIVIDALVSRRMNRVCRTIQFSDTGLIPGSGIGNHRKAVNRKSLGVPVLSIGVPTVIEAATLAADLLSESGAEGCEEPFSTPLEPGVIVTPKDIDERILSLSKLVAYGINLALHPALSIEDITSFLG